MLKLGPALDQQWVLNADRIAQEIGLNGACKPLRFCTQPAVLERPYEQIIYETGTVPCRVSDAVSMTHDWYNAIIWLSFTRTKSCLNLIQYEQILNTLANADRPISVRGPVRDAVTLFDENALLLVTFNDGCDEPKPALIDEIAAHHWHQVFVKNKIAWHHSLYPLAFGHALLQKLESPYKAITAHAWPVHLSSEWLNVAATGLDTQQLLRQIDTQVSQALSAALLQTKPFLPLPVLGIPGWWPDNINPLFYDDDKVFRPKRQTS